MWHVTRESDARIRGVIQAAKIVEPEVFEGMESVVPKEKTPACGFRQTPGG